MLFNESGHLIDGPCSAEVEDTRLATEMADWIERGESSVLDPIAATRQPGKFESGFASEEAKMHFMNSSKYLKKNEKKKALEELNLAFDHDPKNWLIRKQRSALENPDKFYDGDIDTKWQRGLVRVNK